MKNEEIIANVAISSGYMTEEQVASLLEEGREIPLHTFQGWISRGKQVGLKVKIKKGSKGIETRLWRRKTKKQKEENEDEKKDSDNRDFYLTKAFLFSKEQIEIVKEESNC